jgi:outer membrane protein OmpA-like peptidoglycan-associated protein
MCVDGVCSGSVDVCPSTELCDEDLDRCFSPAEGEGEGEGEPAEGEGEGEGEPAEGEGEGEGEPAEGEGEGETPIETPSTPVKESLFVSGSSVFACSNTDNPSSLLMLAFIPFAFLLRKRVAALALVMFISIPAYAEGLNRSTGPVSESDTTHTSSPSTLSHLKLQLGFGADYSHDPVVFRDARFSKRISAVENQFTGRTNAALGLFDFMQVDLSIPVSIAFGKGLNFNSQPPAGFGDLSSTVRMKFTDDADLIQAAVAVRGTLPTSSLAFNGQPILGERTPTVSPGLLVGLSTNDFKANLNVFYDARLPKRVSDLTIGSALATSVGVQMHLPETPLWVTADLAGALSSTQTGSSRTMLPLEGSLGLKGRQGPVFAAAAIGGGIIPDVGTPDARVILSAGFDFDFQPDDAGVVSSPLVVNDDSDGDGIPDAADECPTVKEDFDGIDDGDGCPEDDADGDTVLDVMDDCPTSPEDLDGFMDRDGCPESDDKVVVKDNRIILLEPVFFYFNSDRIKSESFGVLYHVASVLTDNEDLELVSVEGHASSEGSTSHNLKLSAERAAAVVEFLVNAGVDSNRLTSSGFGEGRPLQSNSTEAGRERNRRVEFVIVTRQ